MNVAICHTKDSPSMIESLDTGIKVHGDTVYHVRNSTELHLLRKVDVLICICYPTKGMNFRMQCHEIAKEQKKRIIYVESGCMKFDKFNTGGKNHFQIGYDCIKNYGKYYNNGVSDDRFQKLGLPIVEWKKATLLKTVLIGQNPKGVTSQKFNISLWFEREIIPKLKYGYVYLDHPNTLRGKKSEGKPMKQQLDEARACVAWCSNALVEFIRCGCPTVVGCPGGLAYEYVPHKIEALKASAYPYFDRTQLLSELAYTQWTEYEISKGLTWEFLKPHAMKIEDVDYSLSFF